MSKRFYFIYTFNSQLLKKPVDNGIESWENFGKPIKAYTGARKPITFIEGDGVVHFFVFRKEGLKNQFDLIGFSDEEDVISAIKVSEKMLKNNDFCSVKIVNNSKKLWIPSSCSTIDLVNVSRIKMINWLYCSILFIGIVVSLIFYFNVNDDNCNSIILSILLTISIALILEICTCFKRIQIIPIEQVNDLICYETNDDDKLYISNGATRRRRNR